MASLAKGLQIIELLPEKEALSVSGVARVLGQNRSTTHRFLENHFQQPVIIKRSFFIVTA